MSLIDEFGRIFDTKAHAADTVADLRKRVTRIEQQATRASAGTTAAAVYIQGKTNYTYGNLATVQTQMEALGLKNIFADQAKRFIEGGLEELIARNPDVLIVLTQTQTLNAQQVASLPQLADLSAVRNGRVLSVPFGLTVASPLAVDGLEQLAEQFATCGTSSTGTTTQPVRRCP